MTDIVAAEDIQAPIKGVDVSHFQPSSIDWHYLKGLGYRFAFAKATDGANGVDPMFHIHKTGAKAAGFVFGAYHFFRFDQGVIQQVQNFMKIAGPRVTGDLPHSLDIEWDRFSAPNYDKRSNGSYVDSNHGPKYGEGTVMDEHGAELVFQAKAALKAALGIPPIMYTNYYFWNPGKHAADYADCTPWIPAYHTTADKVRIPAPWNKPKVWIWQNSEHLSVKGVADIDENTFFGGEEAFQALLK